MKAIFTSLLLLSGSLAFAQTQLSNQGFENWGGNTNPPSNSTAIPNEPTGWYSNQSGSTTAQLGPQTCFKDNAIYHGGTTAIRVETKYFIIAVVNGNATTGVVNAPSSDKHEGYIGTINYSNSSDVRRMPFTGRPDSIVGWYQYTQAAGDTTENGSIRTILHVGNFYDPEMPYNNNHPDSSMNKIGDALFTTPRHTVGTWTRFSIPFTYSRTDTPKYVMVNMTSSQNQLTNTSGSKMWVDDLTMIYNPPPQSVNNVPALETNVKAYSFNKVFYVDFMNRNNAESGVTVYDLNGKKVLSQTVKNDNIHSFDMSQYNSGIYLYHISCNGETKNGKFFVE